MRWIPIGPVERFGPELTRVTVLGRHVGIFTDDEGGVRAIEVTCRHQNADLTGGERDGSLVTCPRHGWVYDLETGACLTAPWASLRRHSVMVRDGRVLLDPQPLPVQSRDET